LLEPGLREVGTRFLQMDDIFRLGIEDDDGTSERVGERGASNALVFVHALRRQAVSITVRACAIYFSTSAL
jgi:hypothetical protein